MKGPGRGKSFSADHLVDENVKFSKILNTWTVTNLVTRSPNFVCNINSAVLSSDTNLVTLIFWLWATDFHFSNIFIKIKIYAPDMSHLICFCKTLEILKKNLCFWSKNFSMKNQKIWIASDLHCNDNFFNQRLH